jgi:hypothetical protein
MHTGVSPGGLGCFIWDPPSWPAWEDEVKAVPHRWASFSCLGELSCSHHSIFFVLPVLWNLSALLRTFCLCHCLLEIFIPFHAILLCTPLGMEYVSFRQRLDTRSGDSNPREVRSQRKQGLWFYPQQAPPGSSPCTVTLLLSQQGLRATSSLAKP